AQDAVGGQGLVGPGRRSQNHQFAVPGGAGRLCQDGAALQGDGLAGRLADHAALHLLGRLQTGEQPVKIHLADFFAQVNHGCQSSFLPSRPLTVARASAIRASGVLLPCSPLPSGAGAAGTLPTPDALASASRSDRNLLPCLAAFLASASRSSAAVQGCSPYLASCTAAGSSRLDTSSMSCIRWRSAWIAALTAPEWSAEAAAAASAWAISFGYFALSSSKVIELPPVLAPAGAGGVVCVLTGADAPGATEGMLSGTAMP